MAMIDDIMAQLQSMGLNIGSGFMGIYVLGAGDIAQALQGQYGLTSQQLPETLFQPITEGLLKTATASTYLPQIEATGGNLINQMIANVQGQPGSQAYGGFAGSGQQEKFIGEAKDVYGKGMVDVLTQTGQQRAQGLKAVQDAINQWQSQALQVKGYQ